MMLSAQRDQVISTSTEASASDFENTFIREECKMTKVWELGNTVRTLKQLVRNEAK